jgi:hypothetical protein
MISMFLVAFIWAYQIFESIEFDLKAQQSVIYIFKSKRFYGNFNLQGNSENILDQSFLCSLALLNARISWKM